MPQSLWKKIGKIFFIPCIAFIALLPASSPAQETIRIGGTGSALGTMKALARAFEMSHPAVTVIVMPSIGSSGAIRAVSKDSLQIGVSGRPLKGDELGLGLSVMEYARTPFVPVVHKGVALSDITTREIVKIYSGETRTWPNGERIRLIMRPASDVDTALLKEISPEMSKAVDAALSREGMLVGLTDQQNAEMLEETPGAFGFSTLALLVTDKPRLKTLSFDGAQPKAHALANGSYPFLKKFFFVTKGVPAAAVRSFIDFVLSSEGRRLLEQTGNVPVAGALRK